MCLFVLLQQNELIEVRIVHCPIDYCSQLGIKCIKVVVGERGSASLFALCIVIGIMYLATLWG